ncbi:MAG: amidohydrolase family protein [Porticoccaceae bacterium]|nr:amidohydrolase family protein [Porticoccaceae bacterium]|tara:strand:+ start:221 stop:1708 length:1488 start_codon:yes stop_codon:yes gene_type:complete
MLITKVRYIIFLLSAVFSSLVAANYDLVIANGRVIDPETGLDGIRHLGIIAGAIESISTKPLLGDKTIDAEGLVVAPGFIDIHSHTPTKLGQKMNLLDGVTTQLDMEAGAFPVDFFGQDYKNGAQLNYGASVAHFAVRSKVMEGIRTEYILGSTDPLHMNGKSWTTPASSEQIETMRVMINQGIDQGGLGIGVLLDYLTSAVSADELRMLFEVAGERQVPIHIHVRRGYTGDTAGLIEVINLAKETKAPLFVVHITHNAMGRVGEWLQMIDEANSAGANIATETLSYAAGGTSISADVFRFRDWRGMFDITYEDVQWVATGEWLTKETWEKYAKEQPRGSVNHHYVKEDWIETAMQWPRMMVATDALPAIDLSIKTNPNVAGTFSRVLGHYVRDTGLLTLSDALARLSLYQAQWLSQASSSFDKKGRIQEGVDADIVIFNASTVQANAAYGDPYQAPTGIPFVIVGGQLVVKNGVLIDGVYPGKRLLGKVVSTPL